jgi:hypothetical protein
MNTMLEVGDLLEEKWKLTPWEEISFGKLIKGQDPRVLYPDHHKASFLQQSQAFI